MSSLLNLKEFLSMDLEVRFASIGNSTTLRLLKVEISALFASHNDKCDKAFLDLLVTSLNTFIKFFHLSGMDNAFGVNLIV